MKETLLQALRACVGPAQVLTEGDLSRYELDWRKRWRGRAMAVVRPGSTAEVAAVVRACAQQLAAAIRPLDATIVYNLALVCRAQGDAEHALRCCDRALALAPEFVPAQRLRAALVTAAA